MKPARIFTPPNRLAKLLVGHDRVAFDVLVDNAEKRIETIREDVQAQVRKDIGRIMAIHSQGEEIMFARCREIGDAAMAIADVAGAAGMPELGEIASGVRAMVDSLFYKGVWHTDALELHITSLLLLESDPPPAAEEVERVLTRLRKLRAAVGVVE